MAKKKPEIVNVKLDLGRSLHKRLAEAARRSGLSENEIVIACLTLAIAHRGS